MHNDSVQFFVLWRKNLVSKYPDSFEDRKNGKKFGVGFITMYQSLLNRNNYESSLSKANGNEKPKCKTKNFKFLSQAKLGAVNWNVEDYPDGENFDTAEARRTMLHSAYTIIQELQRPAPPDMHGDILINISLSFKL